MESDIYEDTGKLVKLLKNEFREVNVDIEIIHDHYKGINEYRVSGCIDLGMFNFSIGSDTFSLSLSFNPYSIRTVSLCPCITPLPCESIPRKPGIGWSQRFKKL